MSQSRETFLSVDCSYIELALLKSFSLHMIWLKDRSLGRILSLTELFTATVSPLAGYYHSQSCLQLWFLPWQDIITHRAVYNYGFSLGGILSLYNYGFSLGRILSLTELFTTMVSPYFLWFFTTKYGLWFTVMKLRYVVIV